MTMQLTIEQIGQLGLSEQLAPSKLNNFMSSLNAYADMSPDLGIRKEVNGWMLRRDRQALSLSDWCEYFDKGQTEGTGDSQIEGTGNSQIEGTDDSHAVLAFIYESFSEYSGLDFGRVRPNDSLNTQLKFPLVCWFDWTINFCEDFFQAFDVDLSDRFDEADFTTIGELAGFLVSQVGNSGQMTAA